ncbi:MAG: formylglycine-generating enzyme family protein [Myxococcota bacterium]|nr:formylglycine-generating enzyme family protein [Myxococcota bacterium]
MRSLTTKYRCLAAIAFTCGCSVWIDDFSIDDSTSDSESPDASDSDSDIDTDTDGDVDTDSDSDADTDTDVSLVDCDHWVTPQLGDDIEVCSIKGGSAFVGCDPTVTSESCMQDEEPAHRVTFSGFSMLRYEVTAAQFLAFVTSDPTWAPDGASAETKCSASYLKDWNNGVPPAGTEQRPVVDVCWHAAEAYCAWIGDGYRLPTEAEWEFVARGPHDGHGPAAYWTYPFGNDPNCTLANYAGCAGSPQAVGEAEGESPYGLADMGGNAWEWTNDWYDPLFYCDPRETDNYTPPNCDSQYEWIDPQGPTDGATKVVRGGSWYHPIDLMRSAKRQGLDPTTSSNLTGFRCAR